MKDNRIHRWDAGAIGKSILIGAIVEGILIAPAVFTPWGHAGPNSLLGWLSVALHFPGILLVNSLGLAVISDATEFQFFALVYLLHALLLSYFLFVILRWRQRKTAK